MNIKNSNALSYLDKIRYSYGIEKMKAFFHEIGEKEKENAIRLINDNRLFFCTLHALIPEIKALNLQENLSQRNNITLKICDKILNKKNNNSDNLLVENSDLVANALRWILKTGAIDDGSYDDFDEVLDLAASLLINTYKDKTILPIVADMVFNRNRKGYFTNDLVWVFFQARDLNAIKIIAEYLHSKNQKDVKLACKLLNLEPPKDNISSQEKQKQYTAYLSRLKEDYPYIFFTGQSFLLTSNPKHYNVDLEAKYLCKNISPINKKPLSPYTETECNCLDCFNNADYDSKVLLSKYSNKIHNKDINLWDKWMKNPIDEQINIAKTGLGGRRV